MPGSKVFLFLILLSFNAFYAQAQQKTKEQLQREREINLNKIKEAQQTLKETGNKKKASMGQLNALKFQIKTRKKLINGIRQEIALLDGEINDNLDVIAALEDDLQNLKQEYAAMVYAAYKASNGRSKLTFLFSAESFNQLFRRLEYMEQYAEARKKQVAQIAAVQEILKEENAAVEAQKVEKGALLAEQLAENDKLISLQKKEQAVIASLTKEEKKLKKDLARRKASIKALDKLINNIIKREAEAAAKAAAANKNKAAIALSADFSKNKLKLPWPATGFVSLKFGRSRDPVLKMVERNSKGIEIQTKPNTDATSVFNGEISVIALIPGFNKAVIVKHGDFFTVYAKLEEVYVKKGQKVNIGDKIGRVFTNSDGIAELHFELWQVKENGTVNLNPEHWLLKK